MTKDYEEGLGREVAEVKFLIHDLRVEKFINEIIHFHATLNADLEIHNIEQAQALHDDDRLELKNQALGVRRSLKEYTNAVRSFSPRKTILLAGMKYVRNVHEICRLILDPMWGRVDKVLSFLPQDARSVLSRKHYRNCIHWICGVYYRIEHFLDEALGKGVYEEFDIGGDIEDFTTHVIRGYVVEKSAARVELQLGRLDPVVIGGNRHRFRRMYFNLVMNAVDAMGDRKVGVLNVSAVAAAGRVVLAVRDDGVGMPPEKIAELMADRESLDGEIHSLGFVYVRQTIAALGGELSIESAVGRGTTVNVSLPVIPGGVPAPRMPSKCEKYEVHWEDTSARPVPAANTRPATAQAAPAEKQATAGTSENEGRQWGRLVYEDYERSEAEFPGGIFAMSVTEEDRVDLFTHKPYERHWNITHEDLSPMLFTAVVRGRIEEDEEKRPILILKAPQNVRDYFDLKELPEDERGSERFVRMVHDEYVRVARKLRITGLESDIGVQLTDLAKFFPDSADLTEDEPFPLEALARQPLSREAGPLLRPS